ncbi:alanyl-tRNA editing protein AlaXM [Methanolobus psychrotolerans]|uniref:alanyl-tRNA editing protein AlaXM n=1 Tax=Methanolobus psychrotolerans TaxID=1874706 RepID=UPI000B91B66B|nr:alanyl-tRNA editing protein AlaXM [Methanolobus psychrotolerans]
MKELYLTDCYLKEFDATVESVKEDKFVVLDRTAFYPNSGGQPNDTGMLVREDGAEFPVTGVAKFDGDISHEVTVPGLKTGDKVKGIINWDRRYLFMQYHTACHILSAIIHNETGAKISGNQLGEDKTRVDFNLEDFDREQIRSYEDKVNEIIDRKMPVRIDIMPREEAFRIPSVVKLKDAFPPEIEDIRVIIIPEVDTQACGGTHMANTGDIPHIEIIKAENKGKNNRRIYFQFRSN